MRLPSFPPLSAFPRVAVILVPVFPLLILGILVMGGGQET